MAEDLRDRGTGYPVGFSEMAVHRGNAGSGAGRLLYEGGGVMVRLVFQPKHSGREVIKAAQGARELGIEFTSSSEVCSPDVPVGDVEFCERAWRTQTGLPSPRPDFYPTWLSHWMHRSYAVRIVGTTAGSRTFVKSAESYKAWPPKIVWPGEKFPDGLLCVSQVVEFIQEWRYYVAGGAVVATGWYDGWNEDEPAPELGIDWPEGFCGAVDFGRLSTGEVALVESHHPYACGWYGDDHKAWVHWLISGWNWMNNG